MNEAVRVLAPPIGVADEPENSEEERQPAVETTGVPAPPPRPVVSSDHMRFDIFCQSAHLARGEAPVMLSDPDSDQAEAFRRLKNRVLAARSRVVAVTSAEAEADRGGLGLNLALALNEEQPARVLLLELDRTAPTLARKLERVDASCITEQIATHVPPRNFYTMQAIVSCGLQVAPITSESPAPVRRAHLAYALNLLRSSYAFVVIVGPPVLARAEALTISALSDTTVLAAQSSRTRLRALQTAKERLEPAPVLGVALLDAPRGPQQ